MSKLPVFMRPEHAEAHRQLLDVIDQHPGAVPCVGPDRDDWTSPSRAAQSAAERACIRCPVFALCAAYASAWREPTGVWGGRPRNVAPQPK